MTVVETIKHQIALRDADQTLSSSLSFFVLNIDKFTVASICINMRVLILFNMSTVSICSPRSRVISRCPCDTLHSFGIPSVAGYHSGNGPGVEHLPTRVCNIHLTT